MWKIFKKNVKIIQKNVKIFQKQNAKDFQKNVKILSKKMQKISKKMWKFSNSAWRWFMKFKKRVIRSLLFTLSRVKYEWLTGRCLAATHKTIYQIFIDRHFFLKISISKEFKKINRNLDKHDKKNPWLTDTEGRAYTPRWRKLRVGGAKTKKNRWRMWPNKINIILSHSRQALYKISRFYGDIKNKNGKFPKNANILNFFTWSLARFSRIFWFSVGKDWKFVEQLKIC